MKSYSEKLKDPRWQKMRLQIMERDLFTCVICKNSKETLNVHHRIYRKGRAPWEYDREELVTLCESCHLLTERLNDRIKEGMLNLSLIALEGLAAMLESTSKTPTPASAAAHNIFHAFLSLNAIKTVPIENIYDYQTWSMAICNAARFMTIAIEDAQCERENADANE